MGVYATRKDVSCMKTRWIAALVVFALMLSCFATVGTASTVYRQGDGERGSTEEHFIDIGSEDTASDLDDIIRFLRGGFGNDDAFASEMHFGISHNEVFIDLGSEIGIIELNGFAFIAGEFCFGDTAFDGSAEEELFDCGTGGICDKGF